MKGYLYYTTMRLRTVITYRSDAMFRLVWALVSFFTQIYLWKALFQGSDSVAGVTLSQMMTFVVISRLITSITSIRITRDLEERLKSGEIATDLIRPMNIRMLFAARSIGDSLAALLLNGLPVVIFSIIYLGGILPFASVPYFLLFLVSLTAALVVNILLEILLGTTAFWYMNAGKMNMFIGALNALLSGAVLPLWFMPGWLSAVAYALPLQAIRYTPVQIYLGKLSVEGCVMAIMVQLLWILVLFTAQSLLWSRVVKRIVVFGG